MNGRQRRLIAAAEARERGLGAARGIAVAVSVGIGGWLLIALFVRAFVRWVG